VVPRCPHHVTQRGNNCQDVFFVDNDRRVFLEMLREAAGRFDLKVDAYCLMTNRVHLVATPADDESLARALKRANQLYAQYVNRLHGRSGHLWQDRFFSCALDEPHYWTALAYVERNPVRAGLVRQAWQWAWSSAAAHCGEPDPSGLLNLAAWRRYTNPKQWRKTLAQPHDDQWTARLRLWTSRGRPHKRPTGGRNKNK
jgi:putative transposase